MVDGKDASYSAETSLHQVNSSSTSKIEDDNDNMDDNNLNSEIVNAGGNKNNHDHSISTSRTVDNNDDNNDNDGHKYNDILVTTPAESSFSDNFDRSLEKHDSTTIISPTGKTNNNNDKDNDIGFGDNIFLEGGHDKDVGRSKKRGKKTGSRKGRNRNDRRGSRKRGKKDRRKKKRRQRSRKAKTEIDIIMPGHFLRPSATDNFQN